MRLLLALLLCGCAVESVHVRVASNLPQDDIDTLLFEAEGILGLELIQQPDSGFGAITIDIHNANDKSAGRSMVSRGCRRAVWAEPDPMVVAHEIGHALGLDHVCEYTEGNCTDDLRRFLMHPRATGQSEISDEEQAKLERGARTLNLCNPVRP